MQITPGTRLGPYEMTARIGAGGMGEVWRARDSRLERDVAIKVLPAEFAQDAQFRLRFDREAKTISQFNHPHICSLYDVGDGYLVMELLDGESLADRLPRGALPVEQVLRLGIQIAGALEQAHRRGIVHRDLKPGNVVITKAGAKLLDFGLAKGAPLSSSSGVSIVTGSTPGGAQGETEHKPLTAEGTIVGTFQYMAPEQLEGREADVRSDLFALGALLYEMATGRRAFEGKSRASLIASILDREPPPISEVQPLTPAALENVIRKCLAKDPDERWQSAHDVKLQLQWIAEKPEAAAVGASARHRRLPIVAAGLLALLAGLAIGGGGWLWQRRHSVGGVTRFSIPIATTGQLSMWGGGGVAVSPDGRTIVWAGGVPPAVQLYMRRLETDETVAVEGTSQASRPFFSPDGQWIAFSSADTLKKVPQAGGAAQVIVKVDGIFLGATWLEDSSIVYGTTSGIYRLAPDGRAAENLLKLTGNPGFFVGQLGYRSPFALPGSKAVLFESNNSGSPKIGLFTLADRKWREIGDGSSPHYVDRLGALLFIRNGTLFAARLDLKKATLTGPAVPLVEAVTVVPPFFVADLGISRSGVVAYSRGNLTAPPRTLVSVDKTGNALPIVSLIRGFEDPRISPDGKRIAVTIRSTVDTDVWLIDIARGIPTRATFDRGEDETPIWTPDGRRITFSAERGENASGGTAGLAPSLNIGATRARGVDRSLVWQSFDGSDHEQALVSTGHGHCGSWSPDGKTLAYTDYRADFGGAIVTWSAMDKQKRPFLDTPFSTRAPAFSRDGKWIAYTSNESGRDEVYVRPFPEPGAVVQISSEGGGEASWSPRGDELFFRNGAKMMAAHRASGAGFAIDRMQLLFSGDFVASRRGEAAYDVMPDGAHFLMVKQEQDPSLQRLNVVTDWFSEVEAKLRAAER